MSATLGYGGDRAGAYWRGLTIYDQASFYCDPPYVHQTRGDAKAYGFEMTDSEHRQLAEILHRVQGKVALSGYRCALMDELYGDWQCLLAPEKICHSVKDVRQEALWINYPLRRELSRQRAAELAAL